MKTYSISAIATRLFASLILFAGTFASASAQVNVHEVDPSKGATVKYLGVQDDLLVFHVQYENPNAAKFNVTIKDFDGTTLYNDNFSDRKFDKKFKLPKSEGNKINFIIAERKGTNQQAFEVNTNVRVVEDVVVTRI